MHVLHKHNSYLHYHTNLLSYSFLSDTFKMMENHTLEDTNKVIDIEKESMSGHLEAERLHTMSMEIKMEQPSTMMKMEMKKTDFIKMVG